MEPISILIYLAIFFVAVIGVQLIITMYYVIRVSKKVDKVSNFIDGTLDIFQTLENMPIEIAKLLAKRFFK
ncbi:MAG: hypothetical protein PHS92_05345 [Candidatus Gracilibacteria bacterium]|nr:hypothetical protein [Candidatus Gracilibacteria bacterium]